MEQGIVSFDVYGALYPLKFTTLYPYQFNKIQIAELQLVRIDKCYALNKPIHEKQPTLHQVKFNTKIMLLYKEGQGKGVLQAAKILLFFKTSTCMKYFNISSNVWNMCYFNIYFVLAIRSEELQLGPVSMPLWPDICPI